MPQFIESLESRTLLSVAPSVAQLRLDAKTVTADLVKLETGGSANFKVIEADLKAAGELRSSAKLVSTLGIQGVAKTAAISRALSVARVLVNADVNSLVSFALLLQKHSTSTALQTRVTNAINKLGTTAQTRLTIINVAIAAQEATDHTNVEAILTANPTNTKLSADVKTAGQESDMARSTLSMDVATALGTNVANIILAFPA